MNAEYTTIVSEIMRDYFKFADSLDVYGINVHVLSISDSKGIKELLMADMLLFTIRVIGEDDPITDEHAQYINACIGYDFTPSELAEVRTEVFKKTNTYICALLPYMILFDKNIGTVSFTKMYIICLMYLAIGYISIKESAGTGETVRYYKYTMKAKELAEKVIDANIEIDPICLSELKRHAKTIRQLPYYYKRTVDGRKYVIVHAGYYENKSVSQTEMQQFYLYAREEAYFSVGGVPNSTIIAGHTPTIAKSTPMYTGGKIFKHYDRKQNCTFYDIDCGCGFRDLADVNGRLACMRLGDEEVFYV